MKQILSEAKKKNITKEVWDIFKKFSSLGYEIYLVGGGVRNLLHKEAAFDWDFTTNATPQQIQKLFPDSFYDNKFGTVGIPVKINTREQVFEITTYRTEIGYSDKRRPDKVSWGKTLEEDLERRDFTFNAIVIGPKLKNKKWEDETLEFIDLFEGQKDFDKKLIRAVGNPDKRFGEDALRMLRAVRFASQLGFSIEKKTLLAIQKNAKLLEHVSVERIKLELFKILSSPHKADGYLLLRKASLAKEILPELEPMFGVQQKSPERHHIYDVGTHAVESLRASASQNPVVNLAILAHDSGKPETHSKDLKTKIITFYNHELVSAAIARKISKRLKFSKKEASLFWLLTRYHQFVLSEDQTDKAIRRFIKNVGKENIEDMLELRRADRLGGGAKETSWRFERFKKRILEVQKQPFSIEDLKVNGNDVMKILKIKPGPEVGEVLNKLFEEVEEDKTKNTKKYLLGKIRKLK